MRSGKTVSFSLENTKRQNPLTPFVKLAAVAALATTLAGCIAGMPNFSGVGYDGEIIHGYQADPRSLAQVRPGSSAEQVLVLLGTPSTTSTVGGDAWYYITSDTKRTVAFMDPKVVDRHIYAVYFDKTKKVQRVANYGMEDGKVVDFVSRTTPTGGAESTFLRGMFFNLLRFG